MPDAQMSEGPGLVQGSPLESRGMQAGMSMVRSQKRPSRQSRVLLQAAPVSSQRRQVSVAVSQKPPSHRLVAAQDWPGVG